MAEVPAALCNRLHAAARRDMGGTEPTTSETNNLARNAYRWIRRAGVAWKIPLNVYQYDCGDGSFLDIHYMHPRSLLEYMLENHPVTIFGTADKTKAKESLNAFWQGYHSFHSTHEAFSLGQPVHRIIPMAVHGDEGRGKRRSQSTVFSLESVLGIKGHSSSVQKSAALRSFSKSFFNYKNAKSYVWSNSKGSDTSLLCEWVTAAAAGFMNEETDETKREALSVILTTGRLSLQWFDITYKHGIFLTRQCGAHLYETGQAFLNGYMWLAKFAVGQQLCLFGVKTKAHF